MSEEHLRFNPHTMHYEVVYKKRSRWRNIAYVFLLSVAFGFLFILVGSYFIKSNKLRQKERELQLYKEVLHNSEKQHLENIELLKGLENQDREIFREIFETESADSVLISDMLSSDDANSPRELVLSSYLPSLNVRYQNADNLLKKEKLLLSYLNFFVKSNSKFISSLPIRVPLKDGTYTLVSGFGKRIHPIFKTSRQHNGLDFAARAGTEVFASADGVVQAAPSSLAGYGTVVFINHGNGFWSLYAQLLEKKVKDGQKVAAGDIIGYVGSTGISIGPHLHYEIWNNNKVLDPIRFLFSVPPKKYIEMLKVASQFNQCLS